METQTLEPILAQHPFFQDLDPNYLKIITGCAANVRFEANTTIAQEGNDANTFYLIRYGQVSLDIHDPRRGNITLETLSDGEVFGWSWLFPPYQWHFNVYALSLVRAIVMDGKCLRDKIAADHALGYELMSRFAQVVMHRLEATRVQLLDLYR